MSLYVHIPFCKHICAYCDFAKVFYNEKWASQYLDLLEKELIERNGNIAHDTVYIGGGSPSSLNVSQLKRLFDILKAPLSHPIEATIEVNPEDLTLEKAKLFKANNINRVSLGVQTFQNHLLEKIGRHHDLQIVRNALNYLVEAGIERISIDFIYGLPNQTFEDIKKDLEILQSLPMVKHVSFYTLILEENTKFYFDGVQLKDDEWLIDAQNILIQGLKELDFERYEVSNFAKENEKSQHNLVYWKTQHYIGIGCGASGYIGNERYDNTKSITKYLKGETTQNTTKLTVEDEMFEVVMLGLRLVDGINLCEFKERFQKDIFEVFDLKRFIDMNLLVIENNYLKTTIKGMDVLDEILIEM